LPNNIISKISIYDKINYLGFIDDIDSFLASQMLMVAPINIGSGLKMKIPHSLSCGTPVITTSIGGEGINVNKDAGLVKSEINYFAKEINELMNDQKTLIKMGEYGKNEVNSLFSEQIITEKFQTLYKSIVKI